MSPKQLAIELRMNLFADRGTDLNAAMDYAAQVLNSLGSEGIAARTAMHVVLNTIANLLDEMHPAPDNPAAGVEQVQLQLDRNALDAIIDARIDHWAAHHMSEHFNDHIEEWMSDNFDPEHLVREAIEDIDIRITVR